MTYPSTNGQSSTVQQELLEAKAQVKLKRAQAQLKRLDLGMKRVELREQNLLFDWVNPYTDLLDRLSSDGKLFMPISIANDRLYGANWPFWRTWNDHALLRGAARLICQTSNQAQGILGGLTSYVIGEGFTFKARAIEGKNPPDGMIDASQQCVNEFHKINNMPARQKEFFLRSRRDGEFLARTFPHRQREGFTAVRNVDASQLVEPTGNNIPFELGSFGCINVEDDLEDIESYWVSYNGNNSEGEEVPASEMVHYKINVDNEIKRGMSDFTFDTYDNIKAVGRLMENMLEGSAVQAAIAMILQHEAALPSEVQAFDDAQADFATPNPFNGTMRNEKRILPGTVYQTPKNMTFAAAPYSAGLSLHTSVASMACQMVGVKWNAPAWLVSGDASAANYASSLTAESPFVKRCKAEQQGIGDAFKKLYMIALRTKAEAGLLRDPNGGQAYSWDDIQNNIDLDFTPSTVETRNKLEEANTRNIELQAGVTSRQNWAAAIGNDWEQVSQDNEEYNDRQGQQGQQLPMPGDEQQGQDQGLPGITDEGSPDEGEPYTEGLLESGFTGKDKHGHYWVNGKQIKAPHETTRQEYVAKPEPPKKPGSIQKTFGSQGPTSDQEAAHKRSEKEYRLAKRKYDKDHQAYLSRAFGPGSHEDHVRDALAAGKNVPDEVLKDYPDLDQDVIRPSVSVDHAEQIISSVRKMLDNPNVKHFLGNPSVRTSIARAVASDYLRKMGPEEKQVVGEFLVKEYPELAAKIKEVFPENWPDNVKMPSEDTTESILEQFLREAGFTGKDKHGHYWVNGKQTKAPKKAAVKTGRIKKGEAVRQGAERTAKAETPKAAKASTVPPTLHSRPEERHKGAAPKPLPFEPPPPKKPRAAGDVFVRPKGDASQTKIGDQTEALAAKVGLRNILPPGKRTFTPEERKKFGSTIDTEYDHSGRLYEIKMCQTTATEYRLKAKKEEKDEKLRYAKKVKAKPYVAVAVMDREAGTVHFYVGKKPGLIGSEVNDKDYDFIGVARLEDVK